MSLYCHDDDSETLRQDGAKKSRAVAARLLSRRTRRTAFVNTAVSARTPALRSEINLPSANFDFCLFTLLFLSHSFPCFH